MPRVETTCLLEPLERRSGQIGIEMALRKHVETPSFVGKKAVSAAQSCSDCETRSIASGTPSVVWNTLYSVFAGAKRLSRRQLVATAPPRALTRNFAVRRETFVFSKLDVLP